LVFALNAGGLAVNESLKGFTRAQTFYSAQLVIAALSLLFLLWSRRTNRSREFRDQAVHLFLALNICLLLAGGLLTTYHHASSAGEESNTAKGIVVLLVLTLDIVISGHITNRSSRSFPRNSRVLLYLGYILLVGLLVFCLASLTLRLGTTRVTDFDSEDLVERGILLLGIPFLLVTFASRTAALFLVPKEAAEDFAASLQVDQHSSRS
jgi:membrane-associated HD superfamily phosphohydrolase